MVALSLKSLFCRGGARLRSSFRYLGFNMMSLSLIHPFESNAMTRSLSLSVCVIALALWRDPVLWMNCFNWLTVHLLMMSESHGVTRVAMRFLQSLRFKTREL